MASYTVEQRDQMVKLYYQNECSLVRTLRALRQFYGRRGGPSQSTIQRLVAKFKTTGSLIDKPTFVRRRNARSAENIAAVRECVQRNPRQSIPRLAQELGLSQTSIWRILRRDLGMHAYEADEYENLFVAKDDVETAKKLTEKPKKKPEKKYVAIKIKLSNKIKEKQLKRKKVIERNKTKKQDVKNDDK